MAELSKVDNVSTADIAKLNGIAATDIASVCGLTWPVMGAPLWSYGGSEQASDDTPEWSYGESTILYQES